MYEYTASLIRVIDGDTAILLIDLGLGIFKKEIIRLYGINTPELIGPQETKALQAKNRLEQLLTNKTLHIKTYKDKKDKYGRYIADIKTSDYTTTVTEILISEKLGEEKLY